MTLLTIIEVELRKGDVLYTDNALLDDGNTQHTSAARVRLTT